MAHRIRRWVRDESVNHAEKHADGDPSGQAKYHSANVFNEESFQEKRTSMHENPTRAGLVARPCDGCFRSAEWQEARQSVGAPIR